MTSEELAKLAKLKQLRKSKDKPKTESKPQTLNPQSRERKVPSSRVGRLSSFGGKILGHFCCEKKTCHFAEFSGFVINN